MAVEFELVKQDIVVRDLISVQSLDKGFFGEEYKGKKTELALAPEEALYLMDVRNAVCKKDGKEISFNKLASEFDRHKLMARYYCYKDWRDRGLISKPIGGEGSENYGKPPVVNYPSGDYAPRKVSAKGVFFADDLMSVIDDNEAGIKLYEEDWFGQYGTYKAKKHGQFLKLDAYETLFLCRHAGYKLSNATEKKVEKDATARRPDFPSLYDVYEDWRLRGYVLKTGFKFGTHFRLYFPGAKPFLTTDEWMHSKHVIHVFPRPSKMIISEWARAIRVAHGVKKTFILAIPGRRTREEPVALDFLLYHRKRSELENPRHDKPRFVMLALSEEEEIGGEELAGAIQSAKKTGLDLMLSICDRETSVTHYRVKRIELPKSRYEYYEIEWIQP